MIVASGSVTINLDLNRLAGNDSASAETKPQSFRFEISPNSFFTVRLFNHDLRSADPGSMELIWGNSTVLPEPLNASSRQLVLERKPAGGPYELIVRDGQTGFVFFNIEGHLYDYDAAKKTLGINGGRLLISEELANKLGRPADAGTVVGEISIATTVYPIEISYGGQWRGARDDLASARRLSGGRQRAGTRYHRGRHAGTRAIWQRQRARSDWEWGRPPATTAVCRCISMNCRIRTIPFSFKISIG